MMAASRASRPYSRPRRPCWARAVRGPSTTPALAPPPIWARPPRTVRMHAGRCATDDDPGARRRRAGDEDPQPDGWERVTMMDSELIRFTMRNVGLAKDGFAPTRWSHSKASRGLIEPREIYDAQHEVLESGVGATDVRIRRGHALRAARPRAWTTSLRPSGSVPPHPAKVLCARAAHRRQDVRDDVDGGKRRPRQPGIPARLRDRS